MRHRADWQTVLDDKLDLYRFWRSPTGERSARGFGESMVAVERDAGGVISQKVADTLADVEAQKLLYAEPIVVAGEMMPLIESAADLFKPEAFQASDLLTANGFLRLPAPLLMYDRHGLALSFRAIAWSPMFFANQENQVTDAGIHLSLYSHRDDVLAGLDDYGVWEEDEDRRLLRAMPTPYMLAHVTPWTFGMEFPSATDEAAERIGKPGMTSWWQNVQAVFRLSMQTIASREWRRPDRASVKRARRERPEHEPRVTVITLRRPRGKREHEHQEIEWTHRWIVGGHWRNQWFPSDQSHRQVWISPYVKGPEDRPLIVRKGRAFRLAR